MRQSEDDPRVIVLTGARGCGKSTVCQRLVTLAQDHGDVVGGLLTLSRLQHHRKTGLDVQDVATGEIRPLAEATSATDGPTTGRFSFHEQAIAWANHVLRGISTCEWLVIDELGPLELLRGQAWVAGVAVLRTDVYRHAIVVIRPELLGRFAALLDGIPLRTIEVTTENRDDLPPRILGIKKS